ncbi:transposable element Tcb1 transposase [Trichonephila clavipes]|nr:transposable element Tcb1 transposase [Trichonephila clavipes]
MIFLRGRIIGRLECGRSQLEVSEELGIAQSVISRLWQRFQDDASDLSRQLSSDTGTTVSRQTMYRRLGYTGLYARRPVRCVPLAATHCHLRLTWSREHALWTPQLVVMCDVFRRVQRVTMTGHIYRDVILEPHVRLFRGTMVAEFFLWMTTPVLTVQTKHCRQMPSIGGYPPYGFASIVTGLESNRA